MIPTGAVLPYPPGWKLEPGDAGTATAVLREGDHRLVGYLNLTPQQGDESLNNWASFRVAHNIGEGDRGVRRISSSHDLRFRNGRGSCVRDEYSTAVGARYVELACLVAGRRGTSVIVGAAPPEVWSRVSMSIERAISAFTT